MTTPTTMTTSVITTATTTIMTDVVVAPSFGGLMVGCVLLLTGRVLTGTVLVLVTAPPIWGEIVSSEIGAVVRK